MRTAYWFPAGWEAFNNYAANVNPRLLRVHTKLSVDENQADANALFLRPLRLQSSKATGHKFGSFAFCS